MPDSTAGKTQYYTAATLDGFIADPNHSLDWLFQFGHQGTEDFPSFLREVGAVAMGSSTYEWILNHLSDASADHAQPWPYTQPAWVFTTRSLRSVPGGDVRFVRGDVAPAYQAMRAAAAGKNIWLVGGGDLVGQFHDRGLLDEIIVTIAPVTLGAGKPLLPRAITTPPLQLLNSQVLGPFVQLHYAVAWRFKRRVVGFHQDDEGHWVADLECGHSQHVRHDPPWQVRPWVITDRGRKAHLGMELDCSLCSGPR
jgi:dihydrofolate reductase